MKGVKNNFLAIDCGNTRIKVDLLDLGGGLEVIDSLCGRYDEIEWLLNIIEKMSPCQTMMSIVGNADPKLIETVRKCVGENFILLTPQSYVPLRIDYVNPERLGMDRKVAAVGATIVFPGEGVLVIDGGTALTKDLVLPEKVFAGGTISPGLVMRFSSLGSGTHLLPFVTPGKERIRSFGNSTEESIISGVAGGYLDEIEASINRVSRRGIKKILICGGDGEWIIKNLNRRGFNKEIDMKYEPHLAAFGMREIYRYYEENL